MQHPAVRSLLLAVVICTLPLASAAGDTAPAPPTAAASTGYTIDNCIQTFDPTRTEKTGAGYQFWFFGRSFADGKTLKLSLVGPHQATHSPHRHGEDEFFFILEGQAECYLDGQWRAVPPNTSFYCPSGREHGLRNAGSTEMKYLVIKQYATAPAPAPGSPPAVPSAATPLPPH